MKLGNVPARLALALLLLAPARGAFALEGAEWGGGVQMGYTLGQNGAGWPQPWREPLANYNRGGFFISQVRADARLRIDSTLSAVVVGNLLFAEVLEAYLEKSWGPWRVKAGKFRGAGLRSGTGLDEFELTATVRPRYARLWHHYKQALNFRDLGVQGERDFLDGRLRNRLFIHNANGENVFNDEPSYPMGKTTQVLGIDYALDYTVSEYSTVGGHIGARADRQWDEFVGSHDFWEVQYWFKSNALVDGSFYHEMIFPRLTLTSEAMALSYRTQLHPVTAEPLIAWGASTLARFNAAIRWSPFFGYEFMDHSSGHYPDDAVHILRLGTLYRPAPVRHPAMEVTLQYTRGLEEGGRNLVGNDLLVAQFQTRF